MIRNERTLIRRGCLLAVAVMTTLLAPLAGTASATPTHYVTMTDGVKIAVNIRMPKDFEKGKAYPTIFEMSGYDGGSADGADPRGGDGSRGLTKMFEDDYVTVHASVRGTGCSGGEFDLFSWRSALDGREVIEWIADQPWSNGDVGIYGHSYGGITGFMVTATRPPHLRAASLSGLIDDLYRGIVYPGGVSNYGFPLLWTGAIRPVYDVGGGTYDGMDDGDPRCAQALDTRSRTVMNDAILQGLQDTDNTWYQARSLINYAERIEVPIHISGAYQDEQTGPRGPYHLFEAVDNAPFRRLQMGNGDHGTQESPEMEADRKRWMDHFLLGKGRQPRRSSVRTLFETVEGKSNGLLLSRTFPLEQTRWTDYFLQKNGRLSRSAPGKAGGSDTYFSGSGRQSWSYQAGHEPGAPLTTEDAPDELSFRTRKFKRRVAIAGPITATLHMSSTAPDTEVFVQLIDEAPDGSRYFLQRGMLKASHRAVDRSLSDKLPGGRIYRPFRYHTNPTLIEPDKAYRYLVEVFPVGHVFRPGHRLIVKIHAPPAVDSYYAYVPKRPVGLNTVFHNAKRRSKLMLPVVPTRGIDLGPAPKPCSLEAVRCVR